MIYSKQREIILKTLFENHAMHPTADELYKKLKPDHPALSLATVYRNLNQLVNAGIIQKISVPSGSDRFDIDTSTHYHLLCEQCGNLTDVPVDAIPDLMECMAHNDLGISVTRVKTLFYGVCADCNRAAIAKRYEAQYEQVGVV